MTFLRLTTLLLLLLFAVGVCRGQTKRDCDYTAYKSLIIDHAFGFKILRRVQSEYPAIARAAHASGEVEVKVLVNKQGNVFVACAATGHPLLQGAAKAAALQFKFARNFGFSRSARFKQKYIQLSMFFTFKRE